MIGKIELQPVVTTTHPGDPGVRYIHVVPSQVTLTPEQEARLIEAVTANVATVVAQIIEARLVDVLERLLTSNVNEARDRVRRALEISS